MDGVKVRLAKHAGSWYSGKFETLNAELDGYLAQVEIALTSFKSINAIIGPHAGYTYSGPNAAWAYKYLQKHNEIHPVKRIFLFGPSHKKYFEGCTISQMDELQTPLGNLKVDTETVKQFKNSGKFNTLTKREEENQHSLEMHMPYIYKIFGTQAKVIPIMVGVTKDKTLEECGKFLAPYFDSDDSVFIISSDFCHWGDHFDYQPMQKNVPIWQHIEKIDRSGMNLIEKNDIKGFGAYLQNTGNTICGEYPIKLLMHTIKFSRKQNLHTSFVKYDQSSKVTDPSDSSVSYASSVTFIGEL